MLLKPFLLSLLPAALCTITPSTTPAQTDNFDEGNDVGWTHMDPLTEAGVPAGTFSFPDNNSYRFQHDASPNPDELGNARIGSFRPDITHANFVVEVDVVDWDKSSDHNIGILARINEPGLGTTGGYALTLDTSEQTLYFSLIDFEASSILGKIELTEPVDPETGFRLRLRGKADEFFGEIFSLSDLETPLAEIEGFDDLFETGAHGFFATVDPAQDSVDVTFDNFSAFDPDKPPVEPVVISDVRLALDLGILFVTFNFTEGANYRIETSPNLVEWAETDAEFDLDNDLATFEVPVTSEDKEAYFRILPVE
jgi:hypothetical protein